MVVRYILDIAIVLYVDYSCIIILEGGNVTSMSVNIIYFGRSFDVLFNVPYFVRVSIVIWAKR